jgi:hypothetical protein
LWSSGWLAWYDKLFNWLSSCGQLLQIIYLCPTDSKQTPCRFQIPNCLVTWLNMSCCGVISLADFLQGWHDVIHVLEVPRAPDVVWCGVRGDPEKVTDFRGISIAVSPVACHRVKMSKAIAVAYGCIVFYEYLMSFNSCIGLASYNRIDNPAHIPRVELQHRNAPPGFARLLCTLKDPRRLSLILLFISLSFKAVYSCHQDRSSRCASASPRLHVLNQASLPFYGAPSPSISPYIGVCVQIYEVSPHEAGRKLN